MELIQDSLWGEQVAMTQDGRSKEEFASAVLTLHGGEFKLNAKYPVIRGLACGELYGLKALEWLTENAGVVVGEKPTWMTLQPIIDRLRSERVKLNTDYALMLKYGKVHLMTNPSYVDLIVEAFRDARVGLEKVITL